ncbi:G-protein coupled receptor GRL101-like [Physella acuta]|uniref:G-protein coupled receptor GRL101-like n=1 Tax=Physella acuta TaxID=109671 RepID=UPI0027DEA4CF|nr:G-protein coupled receptor GRL101-like [Physella acuta]
MCCPRISGTGIPFCIATISGISSCEKPLDDPVKRTLLWVVAVLSVVGNVTVLVFRFVFESAVITKSYRLFVSNLGLSDFIMGMYLLIIAGSDLYYQNDYVMFESEWRHSTLCSVAGFLATWSSETSAMFVLLITIERYLAVRFPFGTYRITRDLKFFLLILSWTVGLVLSLVPVVYQDWGIYSSNGMCLGLPMKNHREKGLRYSFCAFLVLPGILFILIAIGQMAIFQNISGEKTNNLVNIQSAAKRRREITVAKNLSLVVVSNFLCWFPLFVFGLLATNGHDLSHELYSWLVVFVLPLNSAINPVLYTLPVIYKRWEEFKNRHAVKDT